ncbi:MAG: hypothetical protein RI967_874 [Planctomycetota bacterium]
MARRPLALLAGAALLLLPAPSCARTHSAGVDAPTSAAAATSAGSTADPSPPAPPPNHATTGAAAAAPAPALAPTPDSSADSNAATDTATDTDPDFLARCAAAAAYSRAHEGHVVLVLRNGVEVFGDAVAPHTLETPHQLASGTKSFSGLAAALAVDDGLLDLDERVSDTIEEWRDDPRKSRITVRELLSLSGGIEPLSTVLESARSAAAAGIVDRAEASIAARALDEPGARFRYGPSHFYVFGELLERKLDAAGTGDADTAAYLERRLFEPLGISVAFTRDGARHPNLPGGGRTSARDWATFGEFVRQGGIRHADDDEIRDEEARRLVSRAALDALFVASGPNPEYGLTWWLLDGRRDGGTGNPEDAIAADLAADALAANAPADEGRPLRRALRERLARRAVEAARARREDDTNDRAAAVDTSAIKGVMAAGKGKQRLYILPGHELVVVRFGAVDGGRDFEDARFLALLLGGAAEDADADRTTGESDGTIAPR